MSIITKLHQQGRISDEHVLLYGISGNLPERSTYFQLSIEERETLWHEKIEKKLGPNWKNNFPNLPLLIKCHKTVNSNSWLTEGF